MSSVNIHIKVVERTDLALLVSDGRPMCTAFHEFGTPAPYSCLETNDMFGGSP